MGWARSKGPFTWLGPVSTSALTWQDLNLRADGYQMACEFAATCSPAASSLPGTLLSLTLSLPSPTQERRHEMLPREIKKLLHL